MRIPLLAALALLATASGAPGAGSATLADWLEGLGWRGEPITLTVHSAEGPVVRLLDPALALPPMAAHGPLPSTLCVVVLTCPDIGTAGGLPGPFCDTLSAWVAYTGAPGSAFTQLVPEPGTPPQQVCGGFFGPAWDWALVEMSVLAVADGDPDAHCYAFDWRFHSDGHCPDALPWGGFTTWRFRGVGVVANLGFGMMSFDYLLGVQGVACRDIPLSPVPVDGTPCP